MQRLFLTRQDQNMLLGMKIAPEVQPNCSECTATNQQNDVLFSQNDELRADNAHLREDNRRMRTTIQVNRGFNFGRQQTWFAFGALSLALFEGFGFVLFLLFK